MVSQSVPRVGFSAMDKWSESNLVRWFLVIGCIACVVFAGWQIVGYWRGPTPATVDPNLTPAARWGRPNMRKASDSDSKPVRTDGAK